MDEPGPTLAVLLVETHVLDASDREAAIAWASTLGRDVARAVREAATARRLGALADVLDQRLVWSRFRMRLDDCVPERAAAHAELRARGPDHPATVRLHEIAERMKSEDPAIKMAAAREMAEDQKAFMRSELGRALGACATEATLDAHIDELRASLDVDRMIAARIARQQNESDAEREERVIRETLADDTELLKEPDDPSFSGLWGGAAGRAFRVLSPAASARLIAESRVLRARARTTR